MDFLGMPVAEKQESHARRKWRSTALRVRSSVRFRLLQRWNQAARRFDDALAVADDSGMPPSSLTDYENLGVLGEGGAAIVYLVRHRTSSKLYAMKSQSCPRGQPWSRRTFNARKEQYMLKMLRHPLICALHDAFCDTERLYLVLEFHHGGSLHDIREAACGGSLPEHTVRFYVSQIIQALEFVHTMGFVFRDLKSQNILVGSDGHIRLTDFGVAHEGMAVDPSSYYVREELKPWLHGSPTDDTATMATTSASASSNVDVQSARDLDAWHDDSDAEDSGDGYDDMEPSNLFNGVDDRVRLRSNSLVGSVDYMPPEMIQRTATQTTDVDWWALGCLMYELLYGRPPFQHQDQDGDGSTTKSLFHRILIGKVEFPSFPRVSDTCKHLIRSLLTVEPQQRLGHRQGSSEIKAHAFFQTTQWALLRNQMPPVQVRHFCERCVVEKCTGTMVSAATTAVSTAPDSDGAAWLAWLRAPVASGSVVCRCSGGDRYTQVTPAMAVFQTFVQSHSQRLARACLKLGKTMSSTRSEWLQVLSAKTNQNMML